MNAAGTVTLVALAALRTSNTLFTALLRLNDVPNHTADYQQNNGTDNIINHIIS